MIVAPALLGALASAACGSSPSDETGLLDGFTPPPLPAGHTRYLTPIIRGIPAGGDKTYCQWITAPKDRDITVSHFQGGESKYGHHLVLYANSLNAPVGTSRECGADDMLSVRFVGATPGEGNAVEFALPPGVVFRVPAGTSLMANIHFINTSAAPIDGQGFLDLELVEAKAEDQVAGAFTNYGGSFEIAPNSTGSADVSCTLQQDMSFFLFSNHMHEWGKSAYSELVRADGSRVMLMKDDVWSAERVFDPKWVSFSVDTPMVAKAGDTIHTHCDWTNDTAEPLTFPTEMCVGFGFFLPGGPQIDCGDGHWGE